MTFSSLKNNPTLYTRESQRFSNILVMWGTIWQLRMLLSRLWRWQTILDWDAKLTWYSLSVSHWLDYGLEHGLGIYGFRSTWPCLIIKVLATWVKLLEPSSLFSVINCIFTFCTTNVFDCLCNIMAQFKLIKHKLLN